jgi:3-deoxy-manno-octulosonate cytidylyltransferase (CMP-KDO synthetase)
MSKQVCVIPFRRDFLLEYTSLSPAPLEIIESIDMLRILEHGMKVKMVPTKHQTFSVDTLDDLVRVESIMREASGDSRG